ncbi:MAG TPA: hypothetical protein DCM31_00250 [Deferribacteraceae bacterium]|nr:hypothetical protein [Deferribacteraceae bacterium]
MNRIMRSDIVTFHHMLKEKGYSPGTCNRLLVLLKFIYNCAIRWEILPPNSNPCVGVELFEDNGARERYLTHNEVKMLFNELEHTPNQQLANIIKLLLYTGARKREILDAQWEEIDWARQVLIIPAARSKSKKTRYVPLSDAAVELLHAINREDDIPWIFFNPKTRKPPVSIFSAWDKIRKNAGIPDVRLHDLRHSYASFLINAGRSLYEVQKLLGHYDPKVTMRYAHLSQDSLIDAANVVANLVNQCSGITSEKEDHSLVK